MRKGRFTEEQIVAIVREVDRDQVSAVAKVLCALLPPNREEHFIKIIEKRDGGARWEPDGQFHR